MQPPQWIIEKKRDGQALSEEDIRQFILGYAAEEIPDYQMAALAMAIYLNGMSFEETRHLVQAMMDSGDVLDTSTLKRPVADKHSTGGIGDKVSLPLAPWVAACGLDVPMISGRGLGITGGTLDKLEAIPGYRTNLSEAEMIRVIQDCGCCIIGQTKSLAPADKKLYALRDVTATVPSIPLITGSIMCKKLAESLDALVLDVKFGKGAFMKEEAQARELASTMTKVGNLMGVSVSALLTDMNEPLGHAAGNAVEVAESVECLHGRGPADLMEVTQALGAEMLVLAKVQPDLNAANAALDQALASGAALERYNRMVELQGGNPDPAALPKARMQAPLAATKAGFVTGVDANAIGRGVLLLGAGRQQSADPVNHAVGITELVKTGDSIQEGDPLLIVHADDADTLAAALPYLEQAFAIGETAPAARSRIVERITG